MKGNMFLFLILIFSRYCAAENINIDFIKSFIENEHKPTHLMFETCWGKRMEVELIKTMSGIRVRGSKSLQTSKYLDQGLLFLLDLDCPDAREVMLQANTRRLFRSPYRWLVLSSASAHEAMIILEAADILVDSDFVVAERTNYGFQITEVYKPAHQTPLRSTLRGFYNGTLNDIRSQRFLFRRRRDLLGNPLIMAAVIQDSNSTHEHLEDRLEPQHDYISKVSWLNVKLGFEMLNATPQVTWSYRWGYFVNGSWSGMIEDMRRGKVDVGPNMLVTAERMSVVAYTDNLAPFRVRFIFRQPRLSYVTNIFRLPFSTGVWIALLVCTIASCLGVWAATWWEASLKRSSSQLDGNFSDSLLLTMGAFSQQGCTLEPIKASGRIMTLIMFVTLMALYAAYSANIVVLLQAPSSAIRTLTQLGQSSLTLAANDVDYNPIILKLYSQTDPMRRMIHKKIESDKGKRQYYPLDEGVQKIRQGLFAFHSIVEPVYRRIEDTFQEHEKCDLVEVDYLGVQGEGIPVYKNSPYLELLRVVFKQIQESGIKEAIVKRQQTPKPKCAHKGAMFSSVGLQDLMPVIILMLYGTAFSIIIAVIEIILHRLIQRRRLMQPRKF